MLENISALKKGRCSTTKNVKHKVGKMNSVQNTVFIKFNVFDKESQNIPKVERIMDKKCEITYVTLLSPDLLYFNINICVFNFICSYF